MSGLEDELTAAEGDGLSAGADVFDSSNVDPVRLRNAHVAWMRLINSCSGMVLEIGQRSNAPNDAWRNLESHYRAKGTREILRLSHEINGKMMESGGDPFKFIMEIDRLAADLHRLGDISVTKLKKCVIIVSGLSADFEMECRMRENNPAGLNRAEIERVECRSYDSINVSSTWELTSVSMRYSQGDGVHTPLDWLVLYPRSVLGYSSVVVLCSLVLPSARSCAEWDNNNKDDVCTRTIPAGLKCPPPSKTISPIPRFETYLKTLSERIPRRPSERFSVFKPGTLRQCRFYIGWKRRDEAEELIIPQESEELDYRRGAKRHQPKKSWIDETRRRSDPTTSKPALRTPDTGVEATPRRVRDPSSGRE